jgi:hypothetical protein
MQLIIMNNPLLLILPLFTLVLGISAIIFAGKFAAFFRRTAKYEWRPTAKSMPESYYTPGLVRGMG